VYSSDGCKTSGRTQDLGSCHFAHKRPDLPGSLPSQRASALVWSALPAGARARLTETLYAWLTEQGRLAPVAARLGIHPQTVRYRLARLRELFGDALEHPDQRFWLELALRARPGDG